VSKLGDHFELSL